MKRYLSAIQEALHIWVTLAAGILSTSVLYALLSVSGVPKSISLLIAFITLLVLILLNQYLPRPLQQIIRRHPALKSELSLPVPEPSPSLLPILRGLRERKKIQLMPSLAERVKNINSLQKGRRLALVVGAGSVAQADTPSLRFAESDAQELAAILQQQAGGELIVPPLLGKEATSFNILHSLHYLVEEARENDEIIVYFAGHGLSSEIQGQSLIPYNWDGQREATNALSVEQVNQLISQSAAKRGLLILDACFTSKLDQKSHLPSPRRQERRAEYFARSELDESLVSVASAISQEQLAGSDESVSLPTLLRRVLLDKEKAVAHSHAPEEVTDLQQIYRHLKEAIT